FCPPIHPPVDVNALLKDIEEYNRQRFRSDALPLGKRPWQTLFQLGEAAQRWLRPQDRTKGQIVDVVILEQFLHVLPLEMQAWVRSRKPSTSQEAAQLAEVYLEQQVSLLILPNARNVVVPLTTSTGQGRRDLQWAVVVPLTTSTGKVPIPVGPYKPF
uniref:SCAN box domain-containing protein n=1 Tax=Laticauda laticaudata TaxID=8630 RepID=A0A8C5S6P1_LATLA